MATTPLRWPDLVAPSPAARRQCAKAGSGLPPSLVTRGRRAAAKSMLPRLRWLVGCVWRLDLGRPFSGVLRAMRGRRILLPPLQRLVGLPFSSSQRLDLGCPFYGGM